LTGTSTHSAVKSQSDWSGGQ